MKPQIKRDIVTSALVGITAFIIMMAIALASPSAHAVCDEVDSKVDWRIYECEDLETDSSFRIAQSVNGVIRRAQFPYADGPYRLQYECGFLSIFAPDGVNLRSSDQGRFKFDGDNLSRKWMHQASDRPAYIEFSMEEDDWRDAVKSNRLRVWMPYYRDDVVVDFSLVGLTASHKALRCEHSLEFFAGMRMSADSCRTLAIGELSSMQRGSKSSARLQREEIADKCAWHGKEAVAEFYSRAENALAELRKGKK